MASEDSSVSTDEETTQPASETSVSDPESTTGKSQDTPGPSIPEFAEVNERVVNRLDSTPDRLHGVSVPVWVELGRVEMLIGELLQLGEGSVLRLDRSVGDPVDLISQGVKLARGEVIVVDDCFAIRIREVLSGK